MHTDGLRVDVCIPVYRPGEKFEKLLYMLSRQTVKISVLICMYTREDSEDSYERRDIDGHSLNIKVREIDKKDFDHGRTRNEAAKCSDADVIIFMTDDAIPRDEKLIENLLKGLSYDNTAVCYARQLPSENSSLTERFSREFNYGDESLLKSEEDIKTMGIKAFFCSNVCAAYRKDIFDRLGGFTDTTIFNEDMIFARKVLDNGYRIRYEADAGVIHSHDYTNMQQLKRNFDLAVSQKLHPETFGGISSESEGMRYVKAAYGYMKQRGKAYLMFPFLVTSVYKYIGFKLGKNYDRLPGKLVKRLSMNRDFFEKTDI
ncbi:MAG: glycosyltransferase family 2 protein [Lachnospiraceae bacterium]|nr:glycosyltransferase family 2 protein [Lachnospiraceae bacterium]